MQNGQNSPKNVQGGKKLNTFLNLMIIAVISRHSCKISTEFFSFLKKLSNIPKIDPKILHNVPCSGLHVLHFFLVP